MAAPSIYSYVKKRKKKKMAAQSLKKPIKKEIQK